jgi:hypothetical protein
MLGSDCIGAGAVPSGTSFLGCFFSCCASWHKLSQGSSNSFEAVVVTFVLLYPIGMAVSNLDACGSSGVGSSDGWLDLCSIWCHACLCPRIC